MTTAADEEPVGIRAVSERTGLSVDTLRWYEKEGGADLGTVEDKIAHYQDLIGRGLDCDGEPVDEATAARQRRTC